MAKNEALDRIPFFRALGDAERGLLEPISKKKTYPKGETIFREGDPPGPLRILVRGLVSFRQRQDPKPPATEGEWMEGEAKRIVIDDAKGTIELFENARVNRGGDEVAGDYIFVDQRSDFFQVTSKQGESDGRVRAILKPKPPAEEKK